MRFITRRRFLQETAYAAGALYGPIQVVARTQTSRDHAQNAAAVDPAAIRKLASKITGHVITAEAPDYESSRMVGNRAFDRHPALIVRCANASDVPLVLDFGRSRNLPLAIRGGAHSAAGFGVCEGGVVIDLSGMKRVEVDADKRIARVQAGSLVRDLDEATQRYGLATTLGACPTVGIAGLTLGGGMGTLMAKYGAACDNLLSAQIVTVDGKHVEASPSSNPDLYWAIRGGGGNFGVATALEYRLHPVNEVLAGALTYPAGQVSELLQAYAKVSASAPDELAMISQVLPSEQGARFRVLVNCYGPASNGNELLSPLRSPIKPQEDTIRVMPYLEAQSAGFPASLKPSAYFVMNVFLPKVSDAAIAAITAATKDAPPRFRVMMGQLHGAVTRVSAGDMAFSLREPGYEVEVSSNWSVPSEKAAAVQWVNALRDNLKPFSHGLYVNALSDTSGELIKTGYGSNYARLVEIKKKYDPTNVLQLNPNIKPDQASNA